jgi:hypothetical protein
MGIFSIFKSKKEQFREHVRACFDESVKKTIKENRDVFNDSSMGGFAGGLMVQASITSVYQTLKNEPRLVLLAAKSDFDPYQIIEEECKYALRKYLE